MRSPYVQSQAGDAISAAARERFQRFLAELDALGAHFGLITHDEAEIVCPTGTEPAVAALVVKYRVEEEMANAR